MWLKALVGTSAAALSVGFLVSYWSKAGPRQAADETEAGSTLVACTLNPAERDGRSQRLAALWAQARDTRKLDRGYAFEFAFSDQTLKEATSVIALESRCCSFLDFQLIARPAGNYLLLEVTGPEEVEDLFARSVSLAAGRQGTHDDAAQEPQ